jgi:hypothetical protein
LFEAGQRIAALYQKPLRSQLEKRQRYQGVNWPLLLFRNQSFMVQSAAKEKLPT